MGFWQGTLAAAGRRNNPLTIYFPFKREIIRIIYPSR
jgi:hypothetical protein